MTMLYPIGKYNHANFPFNISKSSLSKTTLHYAGNLTHASLSSIIKESTSALTTTTLNHEGNIAHANFLFNTRTSVLPKTTLRH